MPLSAGMDASVGAPLYERHQPEQTLLYQLVEQQYRAFVTQLAVEGKVLPDYVHEEFEAYLKCGRLEHGFLRVQCDSATNQHGFSNQNAEKLAPDSCTKTTFLGERRSLWFAEVE